MKKKSSFRKVIRCLKKVGFSVQISLKKKCLHGIRGRRLKRKKCIGEKWIGKRL